MLHTFSIQPGKTTVIGLKEDGQGGWQPAVETSVMGFSPDDPQTDYSLLLAGFGGDVGAPVGPGIDAAVIPPVDVTVQNARFTALNANITRDAVHANDPDPVTYPPMPDDHSRDPDWVDRHSGNPANIPDGRALNLKNGNGNWNNNGESFQALERENVGNNGTPQRRYLFGFFRALTLPIRIYVKEFSGDNTLFWERLQIRLGWQGNDPRADGFYQGNFTDPPLATNGEFFVGGVRTAVGANNTLERIEITAADLPATADQNHIHWVEIQGLNFPDNSPNATTGDGSDIWFKVCAAPGAPLPAKGFINVQFLVDYSGSISSDNVKKEAMRDAITEAVTQFNTLSALYNDPSLFRFSLRVIGAPGAARDAVYDNAEYKTYTEEDSSVLFTDSQLLVSFNDANTADQILAACNAVLDDTTVRYAYSPIWRGVCEAVDDFDLARDLTRTAAAWPPTTGNIPRDPALDDANILIVFSDGEETIGGLTKNNVDPEPDKSILPRREAAFLACQKLVLDAGVDEEDPGVLTEDQADLLTAMITHHTGKDVTLSGEDLTLLLTAVQQFGKHVSAVMGDLPSFTKTDATLSGAAIGLWNDIISAQYRKSMAETVQEVKELTSEPAAGTIQHRIWRLLNDFRIGGQYIVAGVAPEGFEQSHPLHLMNAVGGDPATPGWLALQIRQSIINQRWCHTECRMAGA